MGIVALLAALLVVPWLRVALDDARPSRSLGRLGEGRLEQGHVIPPWGPGYVTYSFLGATLGRQYVHGGVRDTLLSAFAARDAAGAARQVIGESGLRSGGPLHGHRTHQNGLSVDLFMPVREDEGGATTLPTWPWQRFGYGWDFDAQGRASGHRIDFEALAALLLAIDLEAPRHALRIERIIIAPEYVPLLLATPSGKRLGALGDRLTRRPVWVRHDEHVHLDFALR